MLQCAGRLRGSCGLLQGVINVMGGALGLLCHGCSRTLYNAGVQLQGAIAAPHGLRALLSQLGAMLPGYFPASSAPLLTSSDPRPRQGVNTGPIRPTIARE